VNLPVPLAAQEQEELNAVMEGVRTAWLAHDYPGIVASSDTVRLQLPIVGRAVAVRPSHAARVLREYLRSSNEIDFEFRNYRTVSAGHTYAQMTRRYVVRGTSDERTETVFLGFRLVDGRWRLREVRVTP
jgi:hypothetical protein